MTKCSFCGLEYAPEDAKTACNNCPLGSICTHQCCPHCGYLEAQAPTWLVRLKNWLKWKPSSSGIETSINASKEIRSLNEAKAGQDMQITHLASDDDATLNRLLSLGLLPGTRVTVVQSFPSFLLQLGYIQIAIDEQLARSIQVQAVETRVAGE